MMRGALGLIGMAALAAATAVAPALVRAAPARNPSEAVKEIGKDFKQFGKKVGEAGKEAGLEIADAAKRVWYRSWRVSKPRLQRVQASTREFWQRVVEDRDRILEDLRRENAQLKARLAREGHD